MLTLAALRRLLPGIEIEDDPFCIGYWSRWAGQDRPTRAGGRRSGWDQADREIASERADGSIVAGASSRISDRP